MTRARWLIRLVPPHLTHTKEDMIAPDFTRPLLLLTATAALMLAPGLPLDAQSTRSKGTGTAAPGLTASARRIPGTGITKTYGTCSQDHAGYDYRAARLLKDGDSKVAKSAAGHAVLYARERYAIQDITTQADVDRAMREMYDFLSWKIGNPSAVAAQWLTAGYRHFDSHADEAAAALLGMEIPGPGHQVRLPRELSSWLKTTVDSLGQADSTNAGLCASMGDSTMVGVGCELLMPLVKDAIKQSIDRIGISSATLTGKSYDVRNQQVELMIYARRNPIPFVPGRIYGGSRRTSGIESNAERTRARASR